MDKLQFPRCKSYDGTHALPPARRLFVKAEYVVQRTNIGLITGLKCWVFASAVVISGLLSAPSEATTNETGEPRLVAAEHPRAAEAVEIFHTEIGYAPFWLAPADGLRKVDYLLGALAEAPSHGLSPARYNYDQLSSRVSLFSSESD